MTDQRIAKWTRWIEGSINGDVMTMHLQRETWLEVSGIISDNGQLPDSYWWEFMRDTYAVSQAVAIRRQVDIHRDVASLAKLIGEIGDDSARISRDFWLSLWTNADLDALAEGGWETQYAGEVGTHLDPAIPSADAEKLSALSLGVKRYVDQHVAHSEAFAEPPTITLTLSDLHDTIDVIGELFRKYYNLLTASSYHSLVPTIQHDWQAVFREPWIKPGTFPNPAVQGSS